MDLWKLGNIRTRLLPGLVVGVLAGAYVGGSVAHLVPERELGLLYSGSLLVYTALRYLRAKSQTAPVCTPEDGQI